LIGYVGRFAPSPTGPLHFGSLLTAVASFVAARAAGGRWLVRIEDIDVPRTDPAHAGSILRALEDHALTWDGDVEWQSRRTEHYRDALDRLVSEGRIFYCDCSRRELEDHAVYPGTCRDRALPASADRAARLRVTDTEVTFVDPIQGHYAQRLARDVGDFVVKRRDGLFAYQLAVVVDDADQGVTHVVRGADLLDNTPRQLHLHELLGHRAPEFAHVPVIVDRDGRKLSKHTGAAPLDRHNARASLHRMLGLLGQSPLESLKSEPPATQLEWAVAHWRIDAVPQGTKLGQFVCA
jgi:glutamyl-Q tRNA(Asp) synthetase